MKKSKFSVKWTLLPSTFRITSSKQMTIVASAPCFLLLQSPLFLAAVLIVFIVWISHLFQDRRDNPRFVCLYGGHIPQNMAAITDCFRSSSSRRGCVIKIFENNCRVRGEMVTFYIFWNNNYYSIFFANPLIFLWFFFIRVIAQIWAKVKL